MNKYFSWVVFVFFLALTSCNSDVNTDVDVETPDMPVLSATNNLLTRSVTALNGFHIACFRVDYPFSLIDVDNKEYSVTSDADFNALVADSSIQNIVAFVYPIKINKEDDTAPVTINNSLELIFAFASCVPDSVVNTQGDFAAYLINTENSCYNLQYPLALVDINGEIVFAQDEADFNERLTTGLYFFHFPIKLTKSDESVLNVGNGNDLFNALIACNQYIDSTFTSDAIIGCYTIVFPCSVRLTNGTVKTIVNTDELNKILISNKFEDFTFPITLKDENGTNQTANDQFEYNELLDMCDNTTIEFGSAYKLFFEIFDSTNVAGPCYTILFPIQIALNVDSTITQVQTINNFDEMFLAIFGQGWLSADLVYPVNLKLKDNTIVGIKNETELDTLIENCD